MPPKCPYCKSDLPQNSAFCINCGRDIRQHKQPANPVHEERVFRQPQEIIKSKNNLFTYVNILFLALATLCIAAFILFSIRNKINSPADKDAVNQQIIGNLYRNTKYKFRIKFPEHWVIKNGDGPNILVKATHDASTILLWVKDTGAKIGDIDDLYTIDEWRTSMKERYKSLIIVESKPVLIDNRKSYYAKYSVTYTALDNKVNMIGYIFALTSNNIMYTIMAGTSPDKFKDEESLFTSSVKTFVVEDY